MGMGFMMPAMFADVFRGGSDQTVPKEVITCPDCRLPVQKEAKFCPSCGHQLLIFQKCAGCGEDLPSNAKFCLQCGRPVELKPQARMCPHCDKENLPNSAFCNHCGERI